MRQRKEPTRRQKKTQMIDFHSHILPGIDDGSASAEESIKLLEMLRDQGVKTVVATPHFYPNRTPIDDFLTQRDAAYRKIEPYLTEGLPRILLGAEVRYYDGIRRMEDLDALCIEGSEMLLLEMPFGKWSEMTLKEVGSLSRSGRAQIILAHIDRYISIQSAQCIERLLDAGVLLQFNASYFHGFFTKRKALQMFEHELVHAIGSDCHNLTTRPPKIGKAFEVIAKYFGSEGLNRMNEYTKSLLCISNK